MVTNPATDPCKDFFTAQELVSTVLLGFKYIWVSLTTLARTSVKSVHAQMPLGLGRLQLGVAFGSAKMALEIKPIGLALRASNMLSRSILIQLVVNMCRII